MRLPLASIVALGLLGASLAACSTEPSTGDELPFEDEGQAKADGVATNGVFEFVIVGSGAGGGPLATNLAWNGHSVLLLEAGQDKTFERDYKVPAFHTLSTENPGMRWDYMVRHYTDQTQAMRDDKTTDGTIFYPRAGTLGGCTSHNAMITVYPHEKDFDDIAALTGDASWNSGRMRQYFQRLESNHYASDLTGHGSKGWLNTEFPDSSIATGSVIPFRLPDTKLLHTIMAGALTFAHQGDSNFLDSVGSDFTVFLPELLGLMNRDLNSAAQGRDQLEGLFTVPLATKNGKRNGTAEVIKWTMASGPKCKRPDGTTGPCLSVRYGALATRALFAEQSDPNATPLVNGVEYLAGGVYRADRQPTFLNTGTVERVKSTREVIFSAGAFNTPQLLKQSGIGPEKELLSFGIPVRVRPGQGGLPAVGTNLQDRYEVGVVHKTGDPLRAFSGCTYGIGNDECLNALKLDQPNAKGTGAYTSNGAVVGLVKRSSVVAPGDPNDLFVFGLAGYFPGYKLGYSQDIIDPANSQDSFSWLVLKAHSRNNKGVVTLRPHNGQDPSTCTPDSPCAYDPRDTPLINFRSFGDKDPLTLPMDDPDRKDLESVVDGVQMVYDIANRTRKMVGDDGFMQVYPNPQTTVTRDDMRRFVRDQAWGHHASCTAPMGADGDFATSVVDSKFRVHGVNGLRIVDASVFPKIPGFFIVVPVYMISEKASDVILGDMNETRKDRPAMP